MGETASNIQGEELINKIFTKSENPNNLSLEQWCVRYNYYGGCRFIRIHESLSFLYPGVSIQEISCSVTSAKNYDLKTQLFSGDLDLENDIPDPFLLKPCFHAVSATAFETFYDSKKELRGVQGNVRMAVKILRELVVKEPKCFYCRQVIFSVDAFVDIALSWDFGQKVATKYRRQFPDS